MLFVLIPIWFHHRPGSQMVLEKVQEEEILFTWLAICQTAWRQTAVETEPAIL